MNSIEFPEMNYKHFREKNAKFHIFLLLSIMGGISLITIYDRKFRHNRTEEGLPKMIIYISPINMVAEDNHLYFAYKSPLGLQHAFNLLINSREIYLASLAALASIFARWFACSDGQLDKVSYSAACSGWCSHPRSVGLLLAPLGQCLQWWTQRAKKKKPSATPCESQI